MGIEPYTGIDPRSWHMTWPACLAWLMRLPYVGPIVRGASGGLLGLAVLGWVVESVGPSRVEVVVHVAEPNVELSVGGQSFSIRGRLDAPIVCELSPGWHHLAMKRGDRFLFEEDFEVRPDANVVRTAYTPVR
jgi:hypothetical protein